MKLENEEIAKAIKELKVELENEKFEAERANKREFDAKERNNQLINEIEKLRARINEIDEEHKKTFDKMMNENLGKQHKAQQKIEK